VFDHRYVAYRFDALPTSPGGPADFAKKVPTEFEELNFATTNALYCSSPRLATSPKSKYCDPLNATAGRPLMVVWVGDPTDVPTDALGDLSLHCVIVFPDMVRVVLSAPSSHITHPGSILGSNPEYCWVPKFTLDAIVYSTKNVLFAAGETTSVTALEGGMMTGLAIVTVFAIVMLREVEVAFLNWKKVPPCVVVVVLGFVIVLNPEFVIYK
jgi:uncharacterized integral membrane protein